MMMKIVYTIIALIVLFIAGLCAITVLARDEIQSEFPGCVKGIDCLCVKGVNCYKPYKPSKGDAWGQEFGAPADEDCPKQPTDSSPRADERMHRPYPAWGCAKGENCGNITEYYGNVVMGTHPNRAQCEWSAEQNNKHGKMLDRCWPLWHGEPSHVTSEQWHC